MVSICSIIKNEQLYLKEWIDWHLSIGFDRIYLCEDIGSKSHDHIVKEYPEVVLFKYNDEISKYEKSTNGSYRQVAYYEWFVDNFGKETDWCAFIDLDEFIHMDHYNNIKDFLLEYEGYNALYVYWRFYGANGHISRPTGLVQDNYTEITDFPNDNGWRYKSIANMKNKPIFLSCHLVKGGVNSFKIPSHRFRNFHKIWINHYFTKSWEDWCERFISKGDLSKGHRKLDEFFILNPDMVLKKKEMMEFYEKKVVTYRKQASR
jgi:hypothetical protein